MAKTTDRPKILIVEDNGPITEFFEEILTKEGYRIIDIVASGKEAIEIALDTIPDLILMDIELKGDMDGITAYEKIKETVDIPVLYISAHIDDDIMARAAQTEPYGFIVKPFSLEELLAEVEGAFSGQRPHLQM